MYLYKAGGAKWWTVLSDVFIFSEVMASVAFMVNSLRFGIDQLMYAPSLQILSYISWYCWCFFIPEVLNALVLKCTPYPWTLLGTVFVAFLLTLALCVELVFHKDLIKEPTSPNPLKLIYKVLQFARRNKYSKTRSTFSYWDKKKW